MPFVLNALAVNNTAQELVLEIIKLLIFAFLNKIKI